MVSAVHTERRSTRRRRQYLRPLPAFPINRPLQPAPQPAQELAFRPTARPSVAVQPPSVGGDY